MRVVYLVLPANHLFCLHVIYVHVCPVKHHVFYSKSTLNLKLNVCWCICSMSFHPSRCKVWTFDYFSNNTWLMLRQMFLEDVIRYVCIARILLFYFSVWSYSDRHSRYRWECYCRQNSVGLYRWVSDMRMHLYNQIRQRYRRLPRQGKKYLEFGSKSFI